MKNYHKLFILFLYIGYLIINGIVLIIQPLSTWGFIMLCVFEVAILISIYRLIYKWYIVPKRDQKMFVRDTQAIIKWSKQHNIDFQQAKTEYIKWMHDRGLKTFSQLTSVF